MKFKLFSLALALIIGAIGFVACQKDTGETEVTKTETVQKASARSYEDFNDVEPPVTQNGHTITRIMVLTTDSVLLLSPGVQSVTNLLFNNTCALPNDSCSAALVRNDSVWVPISTNWRNCYNSQTGTTVWDVRVNY